jgi:S-adenosylmethionine:tRNA ribosyltransferase-isomerase
METAPGKSALELSIDSYDYNLPNERIAAIPLKQRDQSKLLVFKNEVIADTRFDKIADYLKENSFMVFNNTRVVQARLQFTTDAGALIEIFCLEPADAGTEIHTAMHQQSNVFWKCLVGGVKKWKEKIINLEINCSNEKYLLQAELIKNEQDTYIIRFSWNPSELTFGEILELSGKVPIPPYIKREPLEEDKIRYQTIYAKQEGSVAAPTAGLHFTSKVLNTLSEKNISLQQVTLHVGAGTFKPVKSAVIGHHVMHSEQILVEKEFIELLLNSLPSDIAAVGTTSLRTLESLYWLGIRIHSGLTEPDQTIMVKQWDAYELEPLLTPAEALQTILNHLDKQNVTTLFARTQLLIVPGYKWKFVNALVTNFHQPKSTLILLVSAFIGEAWRTIYKHALENDYRFLSYGDGSLLFRPER